MFLEKLEAQGFKSFAQKNVLIFPGFLGKEKRGITAIVGPNGSGKSNVADAVRWALGEQSMKTLRGKKSEDIIFSGTEKKGKLSMAEVSLFLNNEDGAKLPTEAEDHETGESVPAGETGSDKTGTESGIRNQEEGSGRKEGEKTESIKEFNLSPNDLSEIVITRRIYRNGDSEYLLNNNRVRLSDIQMFLAKAKFGQKTYSVIGQGTVEGFLNSSMAERKEFFDEATGVKQFQIKRDESLNKLRSSYENLIQAQMLITEIEPRLKSLTRQVSRLNKRDELEKDLKALQLGYYSQIWQGINFEFRKFNQELLALENDKRGKEKKLGQLTAQMESMEKESKSDNEYEDTQNRLRGLERQRNEIQAKIARLEAQLEVSLEARGKFDLAFLLAKKEESKKEAGRIEEEIDGLSRNLKASRDKNAELEKEKHDLNKKIDELNRQIKEFARFSTETAAGPEYKERLKKLLARIKSARTVDDFGELRKLLEEVEAELAELLEEKNEREETREKSANQNWEKMHDGLRALADRKEDLNARQGENALRISARFERIKLLEEKLKEMAEDLRNIENKIGQNSGDIDLSGLEKTKKELIEQLTAVEKKIAAENENIKNYNARAESKRNRFFAVQKDLQTMQNEVNVVANKLNDIKIASTRFETKLEDLEIEIREDYGDLKAVKDHKSDENFNTDAGKEKIADIKRQLELIGGIDPQVEVEYKETKERYDFLSGQVEDFSNAVASLRKIIKELDLTIKDRFDEEFKVIAKKFEEYFKILFNGGTAKIIKVMESAIDEEGGEKEDKKSAEEMQLADLKKIKFLQKHNATGLQGVEIQATPPGKKIQSIAMLSGGERALTAIALICAIISANPSPFVVLDEVDAALDEANSERLAKILDELSHKTQFIVITHNRASMRRANILYGVTMGDDGVSKLLSVKLDEAAAHASR